MLNFPTLKDVHSVRWLVGLASYFRKSIKGFAQVARPLPDLTKKHVALCRGEAQQMSFDSLQNLLVNRPVLVLYRSEVTTKVHTDTSKLGIGEIKPIANNSRATTACEQLRTRNLGGN